MSVNHAALKRAIIKEIETSGGFLPFDQFMQRALYAPELGYYESQHVFGASGDFITGIDLGPWLGLGFADLMVWGWQQLGRPDHWVLLEQGGGSGRLLTQVLNHLQEQEITMPSVVSVEKSGWMRARQQEHYAEQGYHVEQYAELDALRLDAPVLMMCNELPDAFPVTSFIYKEGAFYERGVGLQGDTLVWLDADQPMQHPPKIDPTIIQTWPNSYISEFNPSLQIWQEKLANMVAEGFVFCVDYGYSQQEYYRANRVEGTLMGHRGHQVVENVLEQVGSCDITAHVDFTALAQWGAHDGWQACSFITQGGWLAQSPSVQQMIAQLASQGTVESMQMIAQAKRMLLPMGMGESFKLLVQAKGSAVAPHYLKSLDRMRDLHLEKVKLGG